MADSIRLVCPVAVVIGEDSRFLSPLTIPGGLVIEVL
jgi:hypothetical protein